MIRPIPTSLWILPVFFGTFTIASAQTVAHDRLSQRIETAESVTIRGSAHPMARSEFDQGQVNGNTTLHGVTIVFEPSATQKAALQKLISDQQRRSSPLYHKWLTPEQYASRFGLTQNDVSKITDWLESQGFTVDKVARSRTQIAFTGSVARINSVFKTELHNYVVDGETHFANSSEISVPAALNGLVRTVRNLDDFRPRAKSRKISPEFTSSISGSHFITPSDFATIYNVKALYDAGIDGNGQKIAVVGDSTISTSGIATFRALSGLSATLPTQILVSGSGTGTVPSTSEQDEAYLDIEWSGAIAKNATIYYVYVGNNGNYSVWDALQYAIDNNTAPVVSSSFGDCESGLGSANVNTIRGWVQQAVTQGQTVVSATGDTGAADCDYGASSATQGFAVDVPSAIPEVTGIGGTEFTGDSASTSTTTYWSASNSSSNGSALSYIPEMVWNDTTADGTLSAGGGGKSIYFTKPSWQTGTGVPSDGQRDVPDLALSASGDHDPYLICGGNDGAGYASCTNGFRDSQNYLDAVGGTSVGAPAFAGIVALINQATSQSGQGLINSGLYSLAASTPSAFHDVTSGNNIVPCTQLSTNCPTASPYQFGYSAGTGYDQASGLGSIDAYNLVTAWPNYGSFSVSGGAATISSSGSAGTSTITVTQAGSFSGTVALTCSSSNSTVGCSLSPTSVTLSSSAISATSTLTITTASSSAALSPKGHSHTWLVASQGVMFASICLLGTTMRGRRLACLLALLIVGSLSFTVGCGGSNSSKSSTSTSAGTYTITVTGTSGSLKTSSSVSVTVL